MNAIKLPTGQADHTVAASTLPLLHDVERGFHADCQQVERRQQSGVIFHLAFEHHVIDNQIVTLAGHRRDRMAHWTTTCRMIAYIEWRWFARLARAVLYRYTLPSEGFESLNDAGMWVSRSVAMPSDVQEITDVPASLDNADLELRVVPTLEPLKMLWNTSLHVSGIRLRNTGTPVHP